jgi:hypothetical protein
VDLNVLGDRFQYSHSLEYTAGLKRRVETIDARLREFCSDSREQVADRAFPAMICSAAFGGSCY